MPTQLAPIAIAALVPLILLVVYLALKMVVAGRHDRRKAGAPTSPSSQANAAVTAPDVPMAAPQPQRWPATPAWPAEQAAATFAIAPTAIATPHGASTPEATPIAPVSLPAVGPAISPTESATALDQGPITPPPVGRRKVDLQLARRYARPATAAWRAWWDTRYDPAALGPIEAAWTETVIDSFLELARPIVIEMDPSPDAPDAETAAAAVRAIYLHPERYILIEDRWFILDAVLADSGSTIIPPGPRWQMGPATDADPGRPRLIVPTPRSPLGQPLPDASPADVVQALAIEGLVETTGMSRRSAARICLVWAGLEDITDDQAADAVSEATRLCQALGVTD